MSTKPTTPEYGPIFFGCGTSFVARDESYTDASGRTQYRTVWHAVPTPLTPEMRAEVERLRAAFNAEYREEQQP